MACLRYLLGLLWLASAARGAWLWGVFGDDEESKHQSSYWRAMKRAESYLFLAREKRYPAHELQAAAHWLRAAQRRTELLTSQPGLAQRAASGLAEVGLLLAEHRFNYRNVFSLAVWFTGRCDEVLEDYEPCDTEGALRALRQLDFRRGSSLPLLFVPQDAAFETSLRTALAFDDGLQGGWLADAPPVTQLAQALEAGEIGALRSLCGLLQRAAEHPGTSAQGATAEEDDEDDEEAEAAAQGGRPQGQEAGGEAAAAAAAAADAPNAALSAVAVDSDAEAVQLLAARALTKLLREGSVPVSLVCASHTHLAFPATEQVTAASVAVYAFAEGGGGAARSPGAPRTVDVALLRQGALLGSRAAVPAVVARALCQSRADEATLLYAVLLGMLLLCFAAPPLLRALGAVPTPLPVADPLLVRWWATAAGAAAGGVLPYFMRDFVGKIEPLHTDPALASAWFPLLYCLVLVTMPVLLLAAASIKNAALLESLREPWALPLLFLGVGVGAVCWLLVGCVYHLGDVGWFLPLAGLPVVAWSMFTAGSLLATLLAERPAGAAGQPPASRSRTVTDLALSVVTALVTMTFIAMGAPDNLNDLTAAAPALSFLFAFAGVVQLPAPVRPFITDRQFSVSVSVFCILFVMRSLCFLAFRALAAVARRRRRRALLQSSLVRDGAGAQSGHFHVGDDHGSCSSEELSARFAARLHAPRGVPLMGNSAEVCQRLADVLGKGGFHLFVLRGPRGSGKSRIVDEALHRSAAKIKVLRGEATSGGGDDEAGGGGDVCAPYQPIKQALGSLIAESRFSAAASSSSMQMVSSLTSATGAVMFGGVVAGVVGGGGGGGDDGPQAANPQVLADAVSVALTGELERLASDEDRALCVVLEELELADQSTLALLQALVMNFANHPRHALKLVLCVRTADPDPEPEAEAVAATAVGDDDEKVEVAAAKKPAAAAGAASGFGNPAASAAMDKLLGTTPDSMASSVLLAPLTRVEVTSSLRQLGFHPQFVAGAAHRLHRETSGNPLWMTLVLQSLVPHLELAALELADAAREAAGGGGHFGWKFLPGKSLDDVHMPLQILDGLAAKLRAVDDADLELLTVAAFQGFQFQASVAADTLGRARLAVLRDLARLERCHRVIRDVRASDDLFQFVSSGFVELLRLVAAGEYHLRGGPDGSGGGSGGGGGGGGGGADLVHIPQVTRQLHMQLADVLAERLLLQPQHLHSASLWVLRDLLTHFCSHSLIAQLGGPPALLRALAIAFHVPSNAVGISEPEMRGILAENQSLFALARHCQRAGASRAATGFLAAAASALDALRSSNSKALVSLCQLAFAFAARLPVAAQHTLPAAPLLQAALRIVSAESYLITNSHRWKAVLEWLAPCPGWGGVDEVRRALQLLDGDDVHSRMQQQRKRGSGGGKKARGRLSSFALHFFGGSLPVALGGSSLGAGHEAVARGLFLPPSAANASASSASGSPADLLLSPSPQPQAGVGSASAVAVQSLDALLADLGAATTNVRALALVYGRNCHLAQFLANAVFIDAKHASPLRVAGAAWAAAYACQNVPGGGPHDWKLGVDFAIQGDAVCERALRGPACPAPWARQLNDIRGKVLSVHGAILWHKVQRPEEARAIFERAMRCKQLSGDKLGECIVAGQLGRLLLSQVAARGTGEIAVSASDVMSSNLSQASVSASGGAGQQDAPEGQGQADGEAQNDPLRAANDALLDEAIQWALRAWKLAKLIGNDFGLVLLPRNLGQCFRLKRELPSAVRWYEVGLRNAEQIGHDSAAQATCLFWLLFFAFRRRDFAAMQRLTAKFAAAATVDRNRAPARYAMSSLRVSVTRFIMRLQVWVRRHPDERAQVGIVEGAVAAFQTFLSNLAQLDQGGGAK